MVNQLLPAIIVLNAKYFPDTDLSAAKVGATSFAFSVLRVLRDAGVFAGLILYKRNEKISTPSTILETKNSILCATLSFNFGMHKTDVRDAIADAAQQLTIRTGWSGKPPLLYYQTDTLVAYQPHWLPYCVTHHGPFYQDFSDKFSAERAAIAFGSDEKAHHLQRQQLLGIQHFLGASKNAFILQHSQLQRNYLLRCGVDSFRMRRLSPPIEPQFVPGHYLKQNTCTANVAEFTDTATREQRLLLITAVARLDFFKNIETLVDAGVELLARGVPVKVLIAGGDEHEDSRRAELLARVPRSYAPHFKVIQKLSRNALYSLFDRVHDTGVFVCPSRYETLGITPLEAALSNVTTVIVDSPNVEASHYFPSENRFGPSAAELANLIGRFHAQGMKGRGSELRRRVAQLVSAEKFGEDLMRAWGDFSEMVLRGPSHKFDNDTAVAWTQRPAARMLQTVA